MAWPRFLVKAVVKKLLKPVVERLEEIPFAPAPERPLIALLSSCGVHLASDTPFRTGDLAGDPTFRRVPKRTPPADLTVSHGHYDDAGVRADPGICLPVAALERLVEEGEAAGVFDPCFTFKGYFRETRAFIDEHCAAVARELVAGEVGAALITPC